MKFFRLFLVAALLPLFFACEKEPEIRLLPEPQPQTDLHKIPVEKALAELNTLLEAIDGPQTRSGTARRVESVKSLRAADLARATRTEKAEHTDIGYYQPDAVVCPRKNSKYSEVGDRIDPTKTGSDYEFTSKKRIIYYNRKN